MINRPPSFIIGVLVLFAVCVQCQQGRIHHEKKQFFRMSTAIEVTVVTGRNDAKLGPLWNSIDSLLVFWDEHYSQNNPRSDVRRLNLRSSPAIAVPQRFGRMLADAIAWGDSTHGMFDATILPVKELWGLGEGSTEASHRRPADNAVSDAVRKVDYRKIRISPGYDTVQCADRAVTVDAGGFAKGYSLIETGKLLDSRGYSNYLISSGDIIARGRRGDGTPWRIGIQHPRFEKLLAVVTFDTGAIFTSGDYENFWMDGDHRVHHIFDPRTGRSCTRNQSVTVRSASAIEAKYLSTGLFCMHADSILSFIEQRGLDCIVVDSAGTVSISRGWKNKVVLQ
jgi:thiamine biosynthesis lipoprotein